MSNLLIEARCRTVFGGFDLQLDFTLEPTFAALFGPSGCGKTSTLKVLAGLARPQNGWLRISGQLTCDAQNNFFMPPERRDVGLVFQDGRLFPHLTVSKNLQFGLRLTRQPRFSFADVVDLLGLAPLLERQPVALSGGESQRVAIGRALLASPQLLLMDEPLAAVDQPAKIGLLAELQKIHRELALPIIYVSHDIGAVLNIATEVLLMHVGKIVQQGNPKLVLENYVSTSLVAGETIRNIVEVTITAHDDQAGTSEVRAAGAGFVLPRLPEEIGARLLLDLPASEIMLALEKPRGLSARNILAGKIRAVRHLGHRVLVEVDAGVGFTVEVVEATIQMLNLTPGAEVFLVIKATAFRRVL